MEVWAFYFLVFSYVLLCFCFTFVSFHLKICLHFLLLSLLCFLSSVLSLSLSLSVRPHHLSVLHLRLLSGFSSPRHWWRVGVVQTHLSCFWGSWRPASLWNLSVRLSTCQQAESQISSILTLTKMSISVKTAEKTEQCWRKINQKRTGCKWAKRHMMQIMTQINNITVFYSKEEISC